MRVRIASQPPVDARAPYSPPACPSVGAVPGVGAGSMAHLQAAAVVATIALVLAENFELPSEFQRCQQSDPQLSECLRRNVPDALRKMKQGIPSLGVLPLEPLAVSSVNIDSGGGPVRISQNYRHIRLHGLTDSDLTSYKADLKHFRLRTDSITPKMEFIADYVMKGRILLLPIQGKGVANITLVKLVTRHDLVGEPVMRDGKLYMHLRDYRVQFTPQKVHLHFSNLFNGDKLLGDQMNRFLNENADLVFSELKEAYEKSLGNVFREVANQIFDKVPMELIFPE